MHVLYEWEVAVSGISHHEMIPSKPATASDSFQQLTVRTIEKQRPQRTAQFIFLSLFLLLF